LTSGLRVAKIGRSSCRLRALLDALTIELEFVQIRFAALVDRHFSRFSFASVRLPLGGLILIVVAKSTVEP
jgi:hypothetical protein